MKIFLTLILILLPAMSHAKPQIVVSITPVASLFVMIAGDKADISVIASGNSCPHHYALKPSDIKLARVADLFVYIDDKFDSFSSVFVRQTNGKSLKISGLKDLKLEAGNWHLWLLPHNARVILRAAAESLIGILPEDREFFEHNLSFSLKKMDELEELRRGLFAHSSNVTLLTDSAEYLFIESEAAKLYMNDEYSSLKQSIRLRDAAKTERRCFVISSSQNKAKYQDLIGENAHLVQLNSENWASDGDLKELYYKQYRAMINAIMRCDLIRAE